MARFSLPVDKHGSAKGFIGLAQLQKAHLAQLERFREWAAAGQWGAFHRHHYDWWAFPVDQESSRGTQYVVAPADARRITADQAFIAQIREGVRLLMRGWGWDVDAACPIPAPACGEGQRWTGYAVRLYKAGRCMQVLHQDDYYRSLLAFARLHHAQGDALTFRSSRQGGACLDLWAVYAASDPSE